MTAPLLFFWTWPAGASAGVGVTDIALLDELQYAVIEPPDGGLTWPSELWTHDEVLAYLNERQNRLLRETLLQVGQADIPVSVGALQVPLPVDWIRTVRVVWRGSDGVTRPLMRSDSFAADKAMPDWQTALGVPLVYMDEESPTLTLQIAPAPTVDGSIDLYYIPLGVALEATELVGDLLTVPDECAPTIKYGALADMLGKEGRGRDVERAKYAQARYQMGVEAVQMLMQGWTA